MRISTVGAVLALLVSGAQAQQAGSASGHWEGAIQIPNQELAVRIDLAKDDKGVWMGTIDIPSQSLKGYPLSDIAANGEAVKFFMKGPPGDPVFDGKLSPDGKSMSGQFTQGGGSLTFALKRTGDARFEVKAKSTSIAKELEGTWEGVLEAGDKKYRLILKMANQADGTATGSLVSLDQKGSEFPLTTITQKGANLKLEIASISASYDGDLKEGALVGQWTQGPGPLPLTFKRPAKQDTN